MTTPSNDKEDMIMAENDNCSSVDPIPSLVTAAVAKDMASFQMILREHSNVNAWMNNLIDKLLVSQEGSESSSQEALLVVGMLAQSDPSKYLLPIAKSFSNRVDEIARTPGSELVIVPNLLQVWIQQMTETSQVAVHSHLLQALIQAIRAQGPLLAHPAINELVHVWRFHWTSPKNRDTASIVSVRCAATFVECVVALGDIALLEEATSLLSAMLQHNEDPLLQLSILDLFPQHFSMDLQVNTVAWLTSSEVVQPILNLLEDSLLAGAALQCASWISTLDDTDQDSTSILRQRVLQHVRDDIGVTSSESDRLAVVHALVQLSSTTRVLDQFILGDEAIRSSWWDMTRLSSPKLQAAILSSVSQVLSGLKPSDASVGIRLYTYLALDNRENGMSTTDWLYNKYSRSPMSELRIATYAIWSAIAGLGSVGATVLSSSSGFWNQLLESPRETTMDARIAKYDLIHTVYQTSMGFLAKSLQTKLEKHLELGPHGVHAVSYDVAVQ